MVKIRLTRMGKHKRPFYRVVVVDSKVRRDGPCIEVLGTYDPMTKPSEIKIDLDKARQWIEKGAQPSDTAKRLLKEAGVEAA